MSSQAQVAPESGGPKEEEGARHGWLDYLRALGPGIISGASDNDPTTVATMSVLGATTVYGLSWLTILIYPMLAAVQIISAQVGIVARTSLQGAVRKRFGRRWALLPLAAVVAVNLITLAADLEGGAAALGLLLHLDWHWFIVPFAAVMLGVLVFGSYAALQRVLKYVLLVFAAYVVSAFLAHPNWGVVLHDTILPPISFSSTYIQGALALLGTTLTSYAYVWETIEEREERPPIGELGLAKADAGFGMLFAVSIFWFILIATGATLGVHHQHAQTAQQAAQALRPAAGPIAADVFALGLLASAVLAVPVLGATSAYVVSSEFGWKRGLSRSPWRAGAFYGALGVSMGIGVLLTFLGISPIQLLFVSGIFGGLGTPITLVFLLLVARDRTIMRDHPVGRVAITVGWLTATIVTLISIYFLWQQFGTKM